MASTRRPRLPTEVAGRRHGVLVSSDLAQHGMGRSAVQHAVSSGDLRRVAQGVFIITGSVDTIEQRALAATLALRGALSHRCAAGWFGIPGWRETPLEVVRLRPGSTKPSPLAVLHRTVRLLPPHVTEWRGVPVTRPARTLFDLASIEHPDRLERAYDTMWSRGLVNQTLMERTLGELEGRGRHGIVLMRRLIDERCCREQPTGSRLERRFEVLNEQAGVPQLRRQVDVGDDDWIGRMDFVADDRALVGEIDSELHHAALLDTQRDASVTARLEAAGWHVLRLREDDVWNRGRWAVDRLRGAWQTAPPRPDRPDQFRLPSAAGGDSDPPPDANLGP